MKLALIGNGAMGRLVAALAAEGGHEVGAVLSSREASMRAEELAEILRGHDAAVDFTVAAAVGRNAEACALAGVPLVEGTTGWQESLEEVRRGVERLGGALVYGANFSIGVQIFYRLVERAAELFAGTDYAPFIEEAHHSRKRDAPSGTALALREGFAAGALLAARWIQGRKGVYEFSESFDEILKG